MAIEGLTADDTASSWPLPTSFARALILGDVFILHRLVAVCCIADVVYDVHCLSALKTKAILVNNLCHKAYTVLNKRRKTRKQTQKIKLEH